MSKLFLAILVMGVLIEPVLSSNIASKNVIDVRGGSGGDRIPHNPFYNIPSRDPSLNMWIP